MAQIRKDKSDIVEVKDSGIHGYGIFANANIPAGELILIIEGEVIGLEESIRRETEENNVYIFYNGNSYIDASRSEKIKYINHSCEPNCIVKGRSKKSLRLVSIKDIIKNEELTIDYGYEEIYKECNCFICNDNTGS